MHIKRRDRYRKDIHGKGTYTKKNDDHVERRLKQCEPTKTDDK